MIPGGWIEAHYTPGLRVPITRFALGHVVITRGVQAVLERHPEGRGVEELQSLILDRHAQGDWGALGDWDKNLNDEALEHGERLLSYAQKWCMERMKEVAYPAPTGRVQAG